jgi:hypothetical protein
MELSEYKEIVKNNVKWDSKRPPVTGGQQCGMPRYPVILRSEELDIEIVIGFHHNSMKNKDLAWALFELALDDLVK